LRLCLPKGADDVLKFLKLKFLVVIPFHFLHLCFENFFFFHFWEKNILNKCPKSYLVLKNQKFCPHFKSVLFRLTYSSPIMTQRKYFHVFFYQLHLYNYKHLISSAT